MTVLAAIELGIRNVIVMEHENEAAARLWYNDKSWGWYSAWIVYDCETRTEISRGGVGLPRTYQYISATVKQHFASPTTTPSTTHRDGTIEMRPVPGQEWQPVPVKEAAFAVVVYPCCLSLATLYVLTIMPLKYVVTELWEFGCYIRAHPEVVQRAMDEADRRWQYQLGVADEHGNRRLPCELRHR